VAALVHVLWYEERDMVEKRFDWQRRRVFSAIIFTYNHPHTRVQNRMVPNCVKMLREELVTSTGATASANGSDDNMDHYFFPNQVAAGGSKVKARQVISGEDKVGSTGTNSPRLSWKSVKWIKSLTKVPVVVKGVLSVEDTV
jgi:isopentenyl diphosphate isomerase/L-lactate dehydrogenase-like FMN-dependent dehydrogenase